VNTVEKFRDLFPGTSAVKEIDRLKKLATTDIINEAISGMMMCGIKEDDGVIMYCDFMKLLCNTTKSKDIVETFRNGEYTYPYIY